MKISRLDKIVELFIRRPPAEELGDSIFIPTDNFESQTD